jgi:hypothetical protein
MDPFKRPKRPGEEPGRRDRGGPEVLPGKYPVKVKIKGHEAGGRVEVLPDPRFDIEPGDRGANFDFILRAGALQETMTEAVERIGKTRQDLQVVIAKAKKEDGKDGEGDQEQKESAGGDEGSNLLKSAKALEKRLDEIEKLFWNTSDKQDIPRERNVSRKIGAAMRSVTSSWDAPAAAQKTLLAEAEQAVEEALGALNRFFEEEIAAFSKQVREAGIRLF